MLKSELPEAFGALGSLHLFDLFLDTNVNLSFFAIDRILLAYLRCGHDQIARKFFVNSEEHGLECRYKHLRPYLIGDTVAMAAGEANLVSFYYDFFTKHPPEDDISPYSFPAFAQGIIKSDKYENLTSTLIKSQHFPHQSVQVAISFCSLRTLDFLLFKCDRREEIQKALITGYQGRPNDVPGYLVEIANSHPKHTAKLLAYFDEKGYKLDPAWAMTFFGASNHPGMVYFYQKFGASIYDHMSTITFRAESFFNSGQSSQVDVLESRYEFLFFVLSTCPRPLDKSSVYAVFDIIIGPSYTRANLVRFLEGAYSHFSQLVTFDYVEEWLQEIDEEKKEKGSASWRRNGTEIMTIIKDWANKKKENQSTVSYLWEVLKLPSAMF